MTSFTLLLFLAPAALAQAIDVTASLDVTGGLARVGAYVPVTVEATNRTDRAVAEVHVSTGGPVDVRAEWFLAAGETGETVVPVFYVGGDLALHIAFHDAQGDVLARVAPPLPDVRQVPGDTALVWLDPSDPDLTEADRSLLRDGLRAERLRVFRADDATRRTAHRCGLMDAFLAVPDPEGVRHLVAVPPGTQQMVQPEAYALFRGAAPPGPGPVRLWAWLALLTGVVLVACLAVPRRFAVAAVPAIGIGAAVLIWLFGGVRVARVREASLFFRDVAAGTMVGERLVLLESRGGAVASSGPALDSDLFLPRPILASPQDAYRTWGVLAVEGIAYLETDRPECLVHWLDGNLGVWHEPTALVPSGGDLRALAAETHAVAALRVERAQATDAGGKTLPLAAWAVAWKESGEADLAWCGRSLAWWDAHRRTGDGPFLVAWFRDPAPEPPEGIDAYQRLPAMVVYGE